MATVGGTYHDMVKRFKYTNVGNATWKSMCECYDGDEIINETEDLPRSNLKNYCLILSSNSGYYINNLSTTYIELTIYVTLPISRIGSYKK